MPQTNLRISHRLLQWQFFHEQRVVQGEEEERGVEVLQSLDSQSQKRER